MISARFFTEYARALALSVLIMTVMTTIVFLVYHGLCGNFWYTEAGVLNQLQTYNPEAVRIIKTERNIWDYSVVCVEYRNGIHARFDLDTSIQFDYYLFNEDWNDRDCWDVH